MVSPIAFALDFASVDEARVAAAEVAPAVGMIKVGLELFLHAGPTVLALGREVGLPVFLDLKLHDIPETVERAVAQASNLGAHAITVHASGGRAMLRRAVARAKTEGGTLAICAVTILTSLDDADLDDVGITVTRRLPRFVVPSESSASSASSASPASPTSPTSSSMESSLIDRPATSLAAESLARLAYDEGVRWFVCSPAEVASLRERLGPDAVLVTPGVRPASAARGDQKRIATPEQAMKDGADWLVVGRPIRDAQNRLAAARAIADSACAARRHA